MPTYDYECTRCGRRFEIFQSITARPRRTVGTDCTECNNKARVKRLIGTGSAVLFKGSGFYETDYRSDSYKQGAKKEKDATSKSDAKDKKSDGDSAAKKEARPDATGEKGSTGGESPKDD